MGKWLCVCFVLAMLSFTSAQATLRVGAVLSESGVAAADGTAQAQVLRALAAQFQAQGGVFGLPVELTLIDDGSNPRNTVVQVQHLIAQGGVSTIICCTTRAETVAVAPIIEAAEVPTLSLSPLDDLTSPAASTEHHWLFSVREGDKGILRSMALHIAAQGGKTLALMTLDNSYGEAVAASLQSVLGSTPKLVAEKRYAPGASVLTPEALWVATRQPDAVIVWGQVRDTTVAVSALHQRGYQGPIYVNPQLLSAPSVGSLDGTLTVAGAVAAGAEPEGSSPTSAPARRYRALMEPNYLFGPAPLAGAYAFDALWLLRGALEQALGYGIDLSKLTTMRQVLRDSLIGMGPVAGATAVFDYSEADHTGIDPKSLAVVQIGK